MSQSSDPETWTAGSGVHSQDRDKLAHFGDEYDQFRVEGILDVDASITEFGPSAYASKAHGDTNPSVPALNVKSDDGLLSDPSQWGLNETPTQNFNWPVSDGKSSFGSEYNFTVEELVENPTNIWEADAVSNWHCSDFEDDPAGETYNSQAVAEDLYDNLPFDTASGYLFKEFCSATTSDNKTSVEHHQDANLEIEADPWFPILDTSMPLESLPRRSMRRSNTPANRAHAQPKSHPCDRCSSAFGRAGDLRRHYRVHFPDRRTFHCYLEGCPRNGKRGFYRRDKFRDHQRQAHGFGSESELVLLEGV